MLKPPPCIVVVSRDATSLQGLTRALMRRALPVAAARGLSEGESWLHRVPVSLIVTDVEELGREELGTLRRLRSEFPHVPIIALASLVTPEARAAAREGVVAAVLQKPVALSQLEEAVDSTLLRKACSCDA